MMIEFYTMLHGPDVRVKVERPPVIKVIEHLPGTSRQPIPPNLDWKVPRNVLCPCGSGKKYKRCHGAHEYHPGQEP